MTDASLVLGFFGAEGLAAGSLQLRPELAQRAIEPLARGLDITLAEAAWGVHRIVNAAMADAVRLVSVQKGMDPRRFALLACGGGGGVHACSVAEELGITCIIVPPYPGLLSAYGLLAAEVQVQELQSFHALASPTLWDEVGLRLASLHEAALTRIARSNVDPSGAEIVRMADMRYVGQSYELTVTLPAGEPDEAWMARAVAEFHRLHQRLYGQHDPNGKVEFTALRLTARTPREAPPIRRSQGNHAALSTRHVYDPKTGNYREVPLVHRDTLCGEADGPMIITQDDTTIIVRPQWRVRVDSSDNIVLEHHAG